MFDDYPIDWYQLDQDYSNGIISYDEMMEILGYPLDPDETEQPPSRADGDPAPMDADIPW